MLKLGQFENIVFPCHDAYLLSMLLIKGGVYWYTVDKWCKIKLNSIDMAIIIILTNMPYIRHIIVMFLRYKNAVYPKKYAHGFALLCFVVVIHWLIFPYPSGLLHWHCGNLTIAPVPAKQPWWIWINTSCEFIMNDCITTTKQSTTTPCAYFVGYTVYIAACGSIEPYQKPYQTNVYSTADCVFFCIRDNA